MNTTPWRKGFVQSTDECTRNFIRKDLLSMKIRKLGDDLYRSLCEVYPDDTAREMIYQFIDRHSLDMMFMSLYYKEEFLEYFDKARTRKLQKEITDDFYVRFNSSRPRDKREEMDRVVWDNGLDELDYANMAPNRRKNYYYQQNL